MGYQSPEAVVNAIGEVELARVLAREAEIAARRHGLLEDLRRSFSCKAGPEGGTA